MNYNFLGHFLGNFDVFRKFGGRVCVIIGGFRDFRIRVLFRSSVCWVFFWFCLMRDSILLRYLLIFDLHLFSTIWLFFVALYIFLLCHLFTSSNLILLLLTFVVAKLIIVELRLSEVDFTSYVFLVVIRSWFYLLYLIFLLLELFWWIFVISWWSCFLMLRFVWICWFIFFFWRSLRFWMFGDILVLPVL